MPHVTPDFSTFCSLAEAGNLVPLCARVMSDQITPVLAYRRLVQADDRLAPSFLLESVEGGERAGRYSFLGAQPIAELIARGQTLTWRDRRLGEEHERPCADPLAEAARLAAEWKFVPVPGLPAFTGGWVGYAGYDAVRYLEGEKLPTPPPDDRRLPDVHLQLYGDVVAFDEVSKCILVMTNVQPGEHPSLQGAWDAGCAQLEAMIERLETPIPRSPELAVGRLDVPEAVPPLPVSNMGEGGYQLAVGRCKEYIGAGDIFQVVPSQRFELQTAADPFDIYRALRVINPSPYMFYLQAEGAILVGSSPEILCHVADGHLTSRPLAGTRRRGRTQAEDAALEQELRSDAKEVAEHVMLVDLGRNDVGRVAQPGSIQLPQLLAVERYSHVMHLSSTVTGRLREGMTCWDALRAILPVGTVSGAPKVRAMQIIDELEPTRRGPYAGAVGHADFQGNMDMAIALRTMVVQPAEQAGQWQVHIQAGAGIVADSDPDTEHQETVSKAAALAKAVHLAERAFT